ncbi:response regulator [Nitrosophilus labii]|uniref:response regulator n=1 Tax=Nitrosophilus labii TaxID=2706014 RepID=UPI001656FC99|nr:response regulator [Nitrosophilus labii]
MKKINVLVVDDDFINLKLLKTMLMKNELVDNIFEAKNGIEALDVLKNSETDLILLDILMPVMNGIEVLKIIRSEEKFKNIPVIVLSTDETKKMEALENGANDFINKPIRELILNEKIKTYAFL